ncbi:hypothetical protein GQ651_07770 [Alphaproteobacteria bacterium GH1-50]|uniref:Antibiotic biosynthesis monooxygenase n=1 Tax=Kangsaoukella pontilimi TaxID=2691042 RepID=A0A7C9J2S0_9RHOB|nr:hypothetical protein [Kangsaoukella pontilimi]MXQ07741.1 hypothetical protein [Kangsaoukella pontilimi]
MSTQPATITAEGAGPVLEIVTFRLLDGTDEAAFLTAAAGTEALLRERGSLVRRALVRDADGLWTDVVEWTSIEAAMAAAEAVMSHPDFAPFGAMIDPGTVTMRHAPIRWRMD